MCFICMFMQMTRLFPKVIVLQIIKDYYKLFEWYTASSVICVHLLFLDGFLTGKWKLDVVSFLWKQKHENSTASASI